MTTHTDLIKWLREADFGAMQEYAAKHADALEAQDKEIEELRRDAERYRWLRDTATTRDLLDVVNDECNPPYFSLKARGDLDAAIDAAMKESE